MLDYPTNPCADIEMFNVRFHYDWWSPQEDDNSREERLQKLLLDIERAHEEYLQVAMDKALWDMWNA